MAQQQCLSNISIEALRSINQSTSEARGDTCPVQNGPWLSSRDVWEGGRGAYHDVEILIESGQEQE